MPHARTEAASAPPCARRTHRRCRQPTPSRYDRYTPVESYTATYQVGATDFDYTKNVENPDGAGYIGEYGIGISERG